MRRLRVLVAAWNAKAETWDRFRPQFEAIAEHHDLVFATQADVRCDWIEVHQLPPITGAYGTLKGMMDYAVHVITELPDFDLMYIRNGGPRRQLLDVCIKELADVPVVMKYGGDGHQVRLFYNEGRYVLARRQQDVIDRISLNNMDMIVPLSSRLADVATGLVQDRSRVSTPVLLGVDPDRYAVEEPPDRIVVGYAGRIAPEKGVRFLRQLIELTPEVEYRMAGSLEIKDFTFPDNCHYAGVLPYEEIPRFLSECSIIVLPSFTEGLPNQILEAYMAARPVICTPEAHPPELPVFGWELSQDHRAWEKTIEEADSWKIRNMGLYAEEWMRKNWPKWPDFGFKMSRKFIQAYERKQAEIGGPRHALGGER